MTLGEVGRIKRVPREAFRVALGIRGRPAKLPPDQLYFRGVVLDTFTGTGWYRSYALKAEERRLSSGPEGNGLPIHPELAEVRAGARRIVQRFRMKATLSRALLALGNVERFELSEQLPWIRNLGAEAFGAPRPHPEGFSYEVTSLVATDPATPPLEEELDPAKAGHYLALPADSARLVALALEIAGEGDALAKADRIREHLEKTCEYTLLFLEREGRLLLIRGAAHKWWAGRWNGLGFRIRRGLDLR